MSVQTLQRKGVWSYENGAADSDVASSGDPRQQGGGKVEQDGMAKDSNKQEKEASLDWQC